MTTKLLQSSPQEAENQLELSLRQAYNLLQPILRPPFSLSIPSPSEYLQLNRAIAYGILTEPPHAHIHFTHLNAIVTDGYEFFVSLLIRVAVELYPKLLGPARVQLIWVCSKLVGVAAIGVENLLLSLLRQINGGDFSQPNLWLPMELIRVFQGNWDWVLTEQLLLSSALFAYLRLLADHYRLSSPELDALKRLEIKFCVRVLRECFGLCLRIGRDLIRLLQDLLHIPEFSDVWTDLVVKPAVFQVPGFSDISQIYHSRTSGRYFLLRITPEMETQLRFMLTHVNWGSQKRYQVWFAKRFLCTPERETIISDIVRFICCAHHPTNEILQSNVISRWALVGWLLKCCRKNHLEANAKLALFYDWLFFNEKVDNIMNIEPAILLMMNSIPKYIDMTHSLLEFLFSLVDNYDINRKDILVRGVSSSFEILLRKGVVCSFENLTSCSTLSLHLKERLLMFIPNLKLDATREASIDQPRCLVPLNFQSRSKVEGVPLNLPSPSDVGSGKTLFKDLGLSACHTRNGSGKKRTEASMQVLNSPAASTPAISKKRKIDVTENLVHDLRAAVKQSKKEGLDTLKNILFSYAAQNSQASDTVVVSDSGCNPAALAFQIMEAFKFDGYEMFSPVKYPLKERDYDEEVQSATALVVRTFMFSPHERMKNMLSFWFEKGHPVGLHLLTYASRLADEGQAMSVIGNSMDCPAHFSHQSNDSGMSNGYAITRNANNSYKEINLEKSLLKCHVNDYISFTSIREEGSCSSIVSASTVDFKLISQLVKDAFVAYRIYLKLYSIKQSSSHMCTFSGISRIENYPNNVSNNGVKAIDQTLVASLFSDLRSCCGLQANTLRSLFRSIFCHLSDLSTAKEEFVRLLVDRLEHVDLVATQFDVGLKRFSIFGKDTAIICHLVRNTLTWDIAEQQKLWGLLMSELAVSKVQVAKIVNEFSTFLDLRENSVVISSLLQLCRCCSPTAELVGTIISLPNSFGDFAAAVLAGWVASSSLMLFNSLAECFRKLNDKDDGCVSSESIDPKINYSAIKGLLNFLETEDMKSANGLSTLSEKISDVKTKLSNLMALYNIHAL